MTSQGQAYNNKGNIKLNSGRVIKLIKFFQSNIYAGIIEGLPYADYNSEIIKKARKQAKKISDLGCTPYLIEPKRRDYINEPGDMKELLENELINGKKAWDYPEWLPKIGCIGIFESEPIELDAMGDDAFIIASSLPIVWYQDSYGLEQGSMNQIKSIDWDNYAMNYDF